MAATMTQALIVVGIVAVAALALVVVKAIQRPRPGGFDEALIVKSTIAAVVLAVVFVGLEIAGQSNAARGVAALTILALAWLSPGVPVS